MANVSFEVKYYRVYLGNGAVGDERPVGYIACLDASTNWSYSQTIYFLPDGNRLPAPTYIPSAKVGTMYRHVSQMGIYIDLLRNEKPVFVQMNDTNLDLNALRTYPEPVGEGE